jgi:hypothetical protein
MTIVEQAVADTVDQLGYARDEYGPWATDGITTFVGAYRERIRAWLDAHAEDKVCRLWLVTVRVRHVRALIEGLLK